MRPNRDDPLATLAAVGAAGFAGCNAFGSAAKTDAPIDTEG
jgi:hypothetical protein